MEKEQMQGEHKENSPAKNVLNLFENGALLARAIDMPQIRKSYSNRLGYDFSTWAREYETAKKDKLYSLSSTLLVKGQKVRTYKSIGVLINSETAKIEHIAENDSCSSGNSKSGDFYAYGESLKSLKELESLIIAQNSNLINEVNVTVKNDAFVGLFANKALSEYPEAIILLVQRHYKVQSGITLPIFIYDSENGTLSEVKHTKEQANAIINKKLTLPFMPIINMFYSTEQEDKETLNVAGEKNFTFD